MPNKVKQSMDEDQCLDLNIGTNALPDHTVADALKELISNARDEHVFHNIKKDISFKIDEDDEECVLRDYGLGIQVDDFIIDTNEEKRNDTRMIGNFGYGLKDALAILISHNIEFEIQTKKHVFTPMMKRASGRRKKTLHLRVTKNTSGSPRTGTRFVFYDISRNDYDKARRRFRSWNDKLRPPLCTMMQENFETSILKDRRKTQYVYVTGVAIYENTNMLFSYDLPNTQKIRKLFNRDRKSLDDKELMKIVTRIWDRIPIDTSNNILVKRLRKALSAANIPKDLDRKDTIRRILKELNMTDKYVFVDKSVDLDMINKIENRGFVTIKLSQAVLKKFKIDSAIQLRHNFIFDKNSPDAKPIKTIFDFMEKDELTEKVDELISKTILDFEKKYGTTVPREVKLNFKNIQMIDDEESDYDDDMDVSVTGSQDDIDQNETDDDESDNDYDIQQDNSDSEEEEDDEKSPERDAKTLLHENGYNFEIPPYKILRSTVRNEHAMVEGVIMACIEGISKQDKKRILRSFIAKDINKAINQKSVLQRFLGM